MKSLDPLNLMRIREDTFVRDISFHHELESTNSTAMSMIATGGQLTPLLVVAERQTAGRGRGSNSWWSTAGALTFTVVVDIEGLDATQVCQASLTTGLAVCQALERFAPQADLSLKWPNDVFLGGKKVCGILIERPPASKNQLVVGIGVNVRNSIRDAPAALGATATSLIDNLAEPPERTVVLIECLRQLERCLGILRRDAASLLDEWRAYCLLQGRRVTIDLYGSQVRGVCRGIDADGALIVQGEEQLHRCVGGIVLDFA